MNPDNTLRLGMVGCGSISHYHGRAALSSNKNIRFVSCCDVRMESARHWASQYGCESTYTDYRQMIREEKLDGIYLATWPSQHREQIEEALKANAKNILCEKALTLLGAEAFEIMRMVKNKKAFLMEGFMYRHHAAIRKVVDLVHAGKVGDIDSIRATFSAYDPEDDIASRSHRDWRQRKECGGGVAYDLACYCVNACNFFAGSLPKRVFAQGGISSNFGTINRLYAILEYENGKTGIIESSKKSHFNQELEIAGSRGRIHIPIAWTIYHSSEINLITSPSWGSLKVKKIRIPAVDSYQRQLENFADVIRKKSQPRVPLIESVVNTFTIEALIQSLSKNKSVAVKIPSLLIQEYYHSQERSK